LQVVRALFLGAFAEVLEFGLAPQKQISNFVTLGSCSVALRFGAVALSTQLVHLIGRGGLLRLQIFRFCVVIFEVHGSFRLTSRGNKQISVLNAPSSINAKLGL